jgi:hypothetical protein
MGQGGDTDVKIAAEAATAAASAASSAPLACLLLRVCFLIAFRVLCACFSSILDVFELYLCVGSMIRTFL